MSHVGGEDASRTQRAMHGLAEGAWVGRDKHSLDDISPNDIASGNLAVGTFSLDNFSLNGCIFYFVYLAQVYLRLEEINQVTLRPNGFIFNELH